MNSSVLSSVDLLGTAQAADVQAADAQAGLGTRTKRETSVSLPLSQPQNMLQMFTRGSPVDLCWGLAQAADVQAGLKTPGVGQASMRSSCDRPAPGRSCLALSFASSSLS